MADRSVCAEHKGCMLYMEAANNLLKFLFFIFISFAIPMLVSVQAEVINGVAKKIQHMPNQILVRFKSDVSTAGIISSHGNKKLSSEHSFKNFVGLKIFKLPPGRDIQTAIAHYQSNPNVLYAEPDYIVGLDVTNDPAFANLWGLNNTGQVVNGTAGIVDADINVVEAWANTGVTGSNSVVIAVIDTGVQYDHPDLAANMWINPAEIAGNGIDDDGNGYIDDVYGINAITNSGDPMDDHGHGTHVAGTIAGVGNNSVGLTGVNQRAKILACKFLNSAGSGTNSDALKCLDYIYELKAQGINIILSNNSWGAAGAGSQSIDDAIAMHRQQGILFVAAAGNSNSNNDASGYYPTNYYQANIISVAATDQNDGKASFSSYGRRTVDVGAPGVNIYSSIIGNNYAYQQGTSMATPHVSGLIALLSAEDPSRDWKVLKNLVISSGTSVPSLASNTTTGRRIRAWDNDGTGAMTCSQQNVAAVISPYLATSTKIAGTHLGLAAMNIQCASPAGTVDVITTGPSAAAVVTLLDDGQGFDQAVGDGIYSGYWTAPTTTGVYTLTFDNGQIQTVTVTANNSVRQVLYRAPLEIAYSPRISVNGYSEISDIGYISLDGYTAYYSLPIGGVATAAIYAIPQGANLLNIPTGSQFTGVNTHLANDVYETLIAGYWDDLDVLTSGYGLRAWWSYNAGDTPIGEAVFEWKARHKVSGNPVQFQIVYTANSSDIEMHYIATDNNGESATVGAQVNWAKATSQNFNTINLDLAANKAWKWRLDTGAPAANAGVDQSVDGFTMVSLAGSGSDPDNGALAYSWTQISGTSVTLNNANTATPSFNAANISESLIFQLTVTDDAGQAATDAMNVLVSKSISPGSLQFSVANYVVNEKDSQASIAVTRTNGVTGSVSVSYATAENTATMDSDYTSTSGTLTWLDDDSMDKTFVIPIINDTDEEGSETLTLNLSAVTGGASLGSSIAILTIVDDDALPATSVESDILELSASTYSIKENAGSVDIIITRSGDSLDGASIAYATTDSNAEFGAVADVDYAANAGTLHWTEDDKQSKTITLDIIDNRLFEGDKTFDFVLSNVIGANLGVATARITIVDDESESVVTNQIPEAPVLMAPANMNEGIDPRVVTFEWKAVIDPDGDEVTYLLEYCTDSEFMQCDANQTARLISAQPTSLIADFGGSLGAGLIMFGLIGVTTRKQQLKTASAIILVSFFISACGTNIPLIGANGIVSQIELQLQANTHYYWKVTATDSNGLSSSSEVWRFTTL